jgi:hypothetical protein
VAFLDISFDGGSKAPFPLRPTSGLLSYDVGGAPLALMGKEERC